MALTNYPLQDGFETTLTQSLSTTGLLAYVNSVGNFSFPVGVTTNLVLNPGKSNMEVVPVSASDSVAKTFTIDSRNTAQGASVTTTAQSHAVGSKVIISDNYQFWKDIVDVVATVMPTTGGTFTGEVDFSGTTIAGLTVNSLTTAQRTALSPTNGAFVYDTDLNLFYQYKGGAWASVDTGTTTPNASDVLAGIVEMATQAEVDAGTATGATGAELVAPPATIADAIQSNTWIYGEPSGGSDTYAFNAVPAISAYSSGQGFIFKADVANTGACTLNVNSVGAGTIKKAHDQDLADNDIEAGSVVHVIYDGTNFQMVNPVANSVATEAYVTANNNITYGQDAFSPSSTASTKVIAHGLGRTPKLATIDWGVATSVSGWNQSGQGKLYHDGSTLNALTRKANGAGSASWASGFNVSDNNSSTTSWIGAVAVDGTNITISVPTFTDTATINFLWKAE